MIGGMGAPRRDSRNHAGKRQGGRSPENPRSLPRTVRTVAQNQLFRAQRSDLSRETGYSIDGLRGYEPSTSIRTARRSSSDNARLTRASLACPSKSKKNK